MLSWQSISVHFVSQQGIRVHCCFQWQAHGVSNLAGDTAHTRSYMHGLTPYVGGLYEIQHVRTREGWRIRDLSLLHFSTDPKRLERVRRSRERVA